MVKYNILFCLEEMSVYNLKIKAILWDWNGTLLNDVLYSCKIVNAMLKKRNKKDISIKEYRQAFSFPIDDYYKKIGFDYRTLSEYYTIVDEFNISFMENVRECNLFDETKSVLEFCFENKIDQYILSGLNDHDLQQQVKMQGIEHFFKEIKGSNHSDATDKIENGKKMIETNHIDVTSAIYIGDTLADSDCAKQLGCFCVLFNGGHQEISNRQDDIVISNLNELKNIIGD